MSEVTVKRGEGIGPGAEARIKELTAEVRALKTELATAQEAAKAAEGLKAKLDEVKSEFKSAQSAWGDEKAMLGAGIKGTEANEALAVAKALYSALPEADRPATLGEWVTSWTPETRPKAVAPYFAEAPAAVAAPAGTLAEQVGAIKPANPAPPKPPSQPPSPSALTREKFGQIAAEAVRTGNHEAYNAAKPEAMKLGYI